MMLLPFDIHAPGTLDAASSLLKEQGDAGTAYAGGTELLLVMKAGFVHYDNLVDIKVIPELHGIRHDAGAGQLVIGATTTHRELVDSPVIRQHLPIVSEMEHKVANARVRNQGTIGGNLCFAEPHSDPTTLFLALNATVVLKNGSEQRVLSLENFVLDAYSTALNKTDGEILTEVRLPLLPKGGGAAYKKFGLHERPTLGVAVVLVTGSDGSIADARIAVGCVGPKPARVPEAEGLLKGAGRAEFEARLNEAADAASAAAEPVDDLHGSAEYKRHLVGVFVRRAAVEALARATGQPPR
jgi:carbon-monoxide dehydrogenase medium subunit